MDDSSGMIALAELARFSADHRLRPFGRQPYQARPPSALAKGWSIRRSASRKSVGRSLSRARYDNTQRPPLLAFSIRPIFHPCPDNPHWAHADA
jgi:hypothetical protein